MYAKNPRTDRGFRMARVAKVQAAAMKAAARKEFIEGGAEALRDCIKHRNDAAAHWHMHSGELVGWGLLTPQEQRTIVAMSNRYADSKNTGCYTIRFDDFPPKKRSLLARWFA